MPLLNPGGGGDPYHETSTTLSPTATVFPDLHPDDGVFKYTLDAVGEGACTLGYANTGWAQGQRIFLVCEGGVDDRVALETVNTELGSIDLTLSGNDTLLLEWSEIDAVFKVVEASISNYSAYGSFTISTVEEIQHHVMYAATDQYITPNAKLIEIVTSGSATLETATLVNSELQVGDTFTVTYAAQNNALDTLRVTVLEDELKNSDGTVISSLELALGDSVTFIRQDHIVKDLTVLAHKGGTGITDPGEGGGGGGGSHYDTVIEETLGTPGAFANISADDGVYQYNLTFPEGTSTVDILPGTSGWKNGQRICINTQGSGAAYLEVDAGTAGGFTSATNQFNTVTLSPSQPLLLEYDSNSGDFKILSGFFKTGQGAGGQDDCGITDRYSYHYILMSTATETLYPASKYLEIGTSGNAGSNTANVNLANISPGDTITVANAVATDPSDVLHVNFVGPSSVINAAGATVTDIVLPEDAALTLIYVGWGSSKLQVIANDGATLTV